MTQDRVFYHYSSLRIKFDVTFEKTHCPLATLTVIVGSLLLIFMTIGLVVTKAFIEPESAIDESCLCWGELQNKFVYCASFFGS